LTVDFAIKANSNPGSGDDISVDISPRGTFKSTTNTNNVLTGAVTDAASPAQVHTLFDTVIDVS
jgi:hypothetical protein